MILRVYARFQTRLNGPGLIFVPRPYKDSSRGMGTVEYHLLEAHCWAAIRVMLCRTGVKGYSGVNPCTVCAWAKDIGTARPAIHPLPMHKVPDIAWYNSHPNSRFQNVELDAPELTSFHVDAVEKGVGVI